MLNYIFWNPKRDIFTIPGINFPIVWYSVLFQVAFIVGYFIFIKILMRYFNLDSKLRTSKNSLIRKKVLKITDKLLVYMIIATILGGRLGHLFFYESPDYYLSNPLVIIKTWKGGLASHGAAVAILIALFIFCRTIKNIKPKLTYIHLLDFVSIPVAFAGFCIRIGNFVNQEVLGKETNVAWAIIFGSPMENVSILPRHPVQLYEAFFYLFVFFLLFFLSYKKYFLAKEGKILALFLILIFGFRFFVEFLKIRQSDLLEVSSFLSMGQYLSIPFVIIGIFFLFWEQIKSFFLKNNETID